MASNGRNNKSRNRSGSSKGRQRGRSSKQSQSGRRGQENMHTRSRGQPSGGSSSGGMPLIGGEPTNVHQP